MTYSKDLRNRVIKCLHNRPENTSIKYIAKLYDIDRSTIYRWNKLHYIGKLEPSKTRKGKLSTETKKYINKYIDRYTNFNYKNLLKLLDKKFKIKISKSLLYKTIKELGITRKKIYSKPFYMTKTRENERIKELRRKLKNINVKDIISIDETSVDTHINSNYGWSSKGKRIIKHKLEIRKRYTVICAINNKKVVNYKIVKGSANGEIFLKFLKSTIRKLDNDKKYLLMDNARIHHYTKLKEYVKDKEYIECVYNVPYSPQYNPIEYVFNEFKSKLRKCTITNKNIIGKINKNIKTSSNHLKSYFKKSLNDLYK